MFGQKVNFWKHINSTDCNLLSIYKTDIFFVWCIAFACTVHKTVKTCEGHTNAKESVQMLIVKLTFSNLFLRLFRFSFILFGYLLLCKPYVCIMLCVSLCRKESKIVFSPRHISTCTPFQKLYRHWHSQMHLILENFRLKIECVREHSQKCVRFYFGVRLA